MSDSKIAYFNTLIFTIITGVFSLLLLLILLFKDGRKFLPLIITIEIGVFLIISVCIIKILVNEKNKEKSSGNLGDYIKFTQCPDYYTKRFVKDKEICSNEHMYIGKDSKDTYTMKLLLGTTNNLLPSTHQPEYSETQSDKIDKFPLSEIDTSQKLKTVEDKCNLLFAKPTEPNMKEFENYHELPWMSMRSKCRAIIK